MEINAGSVPAALQGFVEFNFLHFAFVLFAVSLAVQAVVSLATAAPAPEKTQGLTLGRIGPQPGAAQGRGLDLGLSIVLLAVIAAIWIVFSDLVQ
jgi:hypothetical protein